MIHKNFQVDDRVWIDAGEFQAFGIILGKASEHIVDCYIVLLDEPLPTHKAGVFPEGCITLL
jgi:hypothetical protein